MKKYQIKWIDSKGMTSEWEFWDDVEPLYPSECDTIGWLIDDHKNYKTLAMTYSPDQVFGRITIPACSILSMKELK